jgi:hypothetical protein
MFRGGNFEDLVSEGAEDLPRLRVERESRRHKKKPQNAQAVSSQTMSKLRASFARATLIGEFNSSAARYKLFSIAKHLDSI